MAKLSSNLQKLSIFTISSLFSLQAARSFSLGSHNASARELLHVCECFLDSFIVGGMNEWKVHIYSWIPVTSATRDVFGRKEWGQNDDGLCGQCPPLPRGRKGRGQFRTASRFKGVVVSKYLLSNELKNKNKNLKFPLRSSMCFCLLSVWHRQLDKTVPRWRELGNH